MPKMGALRNHYILCTKKEVERHLNKNIYFSIENNHLNNNGEYFSAMASPVPTTRPLGSKCYISDPVRNIDSIFPENPSNITTEHIPCKKIGQNPTKTILTQKVPTP
jgi:hypothetical protein